MREALVTQAVKFLLQPSVQRMPASQLHEFLGKKGLTAEEIAEVRLHVAHPGPLRLGRCAWHQYACILACDAG